MFDHETSVDLEQKGKTSVITKMTTSTITVTSCLGGCGETVVTVPGPVGVTTTTDVSL
jgi:hypothetical protein